MEGLHLNQYLIYLANAAIVLGFLVVKAAALPVLSRGVGRICGTDGDDVRPFL